MKKLLILITIITSNFLYAQISSISFQKIPFEIYSGVHNGNNLSTEKVYSEIIDMGEVGWMRIKFSSASLGQNSYIKITSLKDSYYQKLDSGTIEQWDYISGYFNGGLIRIELFVDQNDQNISFTISDIYLGTMEIENTLVDPGGVCDDDNRTPSNHKAVGRLLIQTNTEIIVCTGWISSIGKLISASHCFNELFSDLCSSGCNVVIQFNVPYSLPDGTIQHPHVDYQFNVIRNSIIRSGPNISADNDWAIFSTHNNSNTNLQPIQTQNSYLIVYDSKNPQHTHRVIGYGKDGPPPNYGTGTKDSTNHTQQQDSTIDNNGIVFQGNLVKFVIDVQKGNSGSPIIDANLNCAVGIATTGQCHMSGYNGGTSVGNLSFFNSLYPSRTVFLNQQTESGDIINGSKVGIWKNNSFNFIEIPKSPIPYLHNSSSIIVRADTNLFGSRKYLLWERDNSQNFQNITIHSSFDLNNHITEITSIFNRTYPNIVIRNRIDNMHYNDSLAIGFQDPWLIDYPDPQYGNTLRNRGMDALFKQRTSPFYPDYTTSYNGDVYKGVFLNQSGPPLWTPPYYSVKADYLQTFNLSQTGRTHKFYFQGWSANPNGSAIIVMLQMEMEFVKFV